MEPETISKNGTSRGNQINKTFAFTFVLLFMFPVIACSQGNPTSATSNRNLIGIWESNSELEEFIREEGSLVFFANGTFCVNSRYGNTFIAGEYSIYDDVLLLTYNNSRYDYNRSHTLCKFKVDSNILTLSFTTKQENEKSIRIKKIK